MVSSQNEEDLCFAFFGRYRQVACLACWGTVNIVFLNKQQKNTPEFRGSI